ncbi:MAG: polyphenol oxidase family protein, partial [Actinomycetota bacterium]|nr:polyphenol oxidase family protein [Actinomycetota bacterium]
ALTGAVGVGLVVLVADCTPVVLVAPRERLVAVAHAGRAGLVAGVVPATVGALRDAGATDLVARVGPSICGRCYEVPAAMREEVAAAVPQSRAVTSRGTPALDVAAGVLAQLRTSCAEVSRLEVCTAESPDYFSFRRDSITGRFGMLTWAQP